MIYSFMNRIWGRRESLRSLALIRHAAFRLYWQERIAVPLAHRGSPRARSGSGRGAGAQRRRQGAVFARGWSPRPAVPGPSRLKPAFLDSELRSLSEPWAGGLSGRQVSWKVQQSTGVAPQVRAPKWDGNPLRGEEKKGKRKRKKRAYVCYSFIQSHAICQSSFTSLSASGKAAQKQSLLLERTRLVL